MTPNLGAIRRRRRRRMTASVSLHPDGSSAATWTGRASVRPSPRQATEAVTAGDAVIVKSYDVGLPVDAVLPTGSLPLVRVTASVGDPALVGAVLYIRDVPLDDWLTERKLVCTRNTP